jgi:RNA polymerase sigma-70 factor, ECF subfamily
MVPLGGRLTRNRADAEDLVEDTMLKAYCHLHSFRDESLLRAWLHRIRHNTWINDHRKSRCRPTERLSADTTDWQQEARRKHHDSAGCRPAELDVLERLPDGTVIEALEGYSLGWPSGAAGGVAGA